MALARIELAEKSLLAKEDTVKRMSAAAVSPRLSVPTLAGPSPGLPSSSSAGAATDMVAAAFAAAAHSQEDATQTSPRGDAPPVRPSRSFPAGLAAFMQEFGYEGVTSWVEGRTMLHSACDLVDVRTDLTSVIHEMVANMRPSFLDERIRSG